MVQFFWRTLYMYTLIDFFSGDYISALRGCCALKFLHTLEIDQGLLAHTRRGTGVPPKNRENLKLALKFSVLESITSGIHGSIFTKLFYATCHYCERNFVFLKLILHSDLRRRAASRLALPCPSSNQNEALHTITGTRTSEMFNHQSQAHPITIDFVVFVIFHCHSPEGATLTQNRT